MSSQRSVSALREQAMEALQTSTIMLEVASNLLDAGNREEAIRLKEEARAKRDVSVWLMCKANTLENSGAGEQPFGIQKTHGETFH
jgi:hypothetical protein